MFRNTSIKVLAGRLIFSFAFLLPWAVSAADVRVERSELGDGSHFSLRGEIVAGDSSKLEALVKRHLNNGVIPKLQLESPGGSVTEAIAIGNIVARYGLNVGVGSSGCFSSCFFIYAAAPVRFGGRGPLGVHRIYITADAAAGMSPEEFRTRSQALWSATADHLESLQVPSDIIDRMRDTPSDQMLVLSPRDKERLGTFSPWARELVLAKCGVAWTENASEELEDRVHTCLFEIFRDEQFRLLGR